jgi:hypothetical protein
MTLLYRASNNRITCDVLMGPTNDLPTIRIVLFLVVSCFFLLSLLLLFFVLNLDIDSQFVVVAQPTSVKITSSDTPTASSSTTSLACDKNFCDESDTATPLDDKILDKFNRFNNFKRRFSGHDFHNFVSLFSSKHSSSRRDSN